jgi:hypothetical protein
MYLYALAGLISAVTPRRKDDRRAAGRAPNAPRGVAEFNDHYLRDIGFVRERTARPRDHLMRM